MAYNPKNDLIKLGGKDYLEVKFRLVWLREDHPNWGVETELLQLDAVAIVKASVKDETGRVIATGHGMAKTGGNAKWAGREIEKAETAAIGRALAHAGIGTQFIDDETEGEGDHDHIADSPVERKNKPSGNAQPKNQPSKPSNPPPVVSGNSVLDAGFSVETARNFLGWAKRNYGASEESVRQILDGYAGYELTAMPMFPGTILDAVTGVMLVDAQDSNKLIGDVIADLKAGKVKLIAPHGKPFTGAELDMIEARANELTKP